MILVADSGSTKADWVAIRNKKTVGELHTRGFNPFFHDHSFILQELQSADGFEALRDEVSTIYFFGAGCSAPDRKERIRSALSLYFTNAIVTVEHDMLGTALAVCEGKPGLACILGTGSNTCFFNGKTVSESRHGLGYVLGDEASGSYFGKKLLSMYIYGTMPEPLSASFFKQYSLTKEEIIQKVYHQPHPNVFLASFAPFLTANAHHSFIRKLVHGGMKEFFETNVLSYPESAEYPVNFAGSIAHYFRDTIQQVAIENKVRVGNIIQKPIAGLVDYFIKGGQIPE